MKLSRTLPAALPGAVLALGVTACSSDDSDDTNTGKSTGTATESASWPVTVEHTLGSSTIEEKSARIGVLHEGGIDPVLSLGLGPVAMGEIQGGDESMP